MHSCYHLLLCLQPHSLQLNGMGKYGQIPTLWWSTCWFWVKRNVKGNDNVKSTGIRRHFVSLGLQSNCFALLNMPDLHKHKCSKTWKVFFLKRKLMNGKMHDDKKRVWDRGDVGTGDIINSITVLFTAQLHNLNVIITLVIWINAVC